MTNFQAYFDPDHNAGGGNMDGGDRPEGFDKWWYSNRAFPLSNPRKMAELAWHARDAEIEQLVDVIEHAEVAMLDAAMAEDGLDGGIAMELAKRCSDILQRHGKTSALAALGQQERLEG